ncbi:protein of unknown function [Kyrpidia spormannii]|uniref:Uncharacterized protein n=2 Tax=Kyrpidia spormannii TaxID=2055160 RepID=A0A6F9EA23_9BACL|nr:protein of unknown function [Kyrpidia spormannii]CAB3394615.1 protein of unknown function [Kyrpidia spormannii]
MPFGKVFSHCCPGSVNAFRQHCGYNKNAAGCGRKSRGEPMISAVLGLVGVLTGVVEQTLGTLLGFLF